MKSFIMYGAGNIGRGFIGQLMSEAGYRVGFVDINDEVIGRLNADHRYPVNIVSSDLNREIWVENVYGIDGKSNETVANAIAECELMATAVGVNVLKYIAKPIALGIEKRIKRNAPPLNIIICENLLGADKYLKELICEILPTLKDEIDKNVGFVEASIGRMVPVMKEENKQGEPLRVYVEPYDRLPIDKAAFVGELPDVNRLYPYTPFELFIERKLFMHNMSHAICAYLGNIKGYTYVYEAANDPEIRYVAYRALIETAQSLASEHGTDIQPLLAHASDLLARFRNRALEDTVARVGKDTVRKLKSTDRLTGALNMNIKHGNAIWANCLGIAAALLFSPEGDNASKDVATYSCKNGISAALVKYADIPEDSTSSKLICELSSMIMKGRSIADITNYCELMATDKMPV